MRPGGRSGVLVDMDMEGSGHDDRQDGQGSRQDGGRGGYDALLAVVAFGGLYQGAVPLVVRLLFDGDQRFAPALWLPAPWWWLACLGVVLVTLALLAVIDTVAGRRHPAAPTGEPVILEKNQPGAADQGERPAKGEKAEKGSDADGYDLAMGLVLLAGIYNGVAPFVSRLVFDGDLVLAVTLRLPAPWWWLASLGALIAAFVLLIVLDQAKRRHRTAG
jgi:hypothetical protein